MNSSIFEKCQSTVIVLVSLKKILPGSRLKITASNDHNQNAIPDNDLKIFQ
jgi:hypothetical protein